MVIPLPVEEQCRGVLSEPLPNLQLLTGENIWGWSLGICFLLVSLFSFKGIGFIALFARNSFLLSHFSLLLEKVKKKYGTHTTISYLKGPGSRRYKRFILKYSNPQISVCRLFFCICICFVKSRAQDHLILYKKVWFDHKILFYTPRPIPLYILKCEHMQSKLHI